MDPAGKGTLVGEALGAGLGEGLLSSFPAHSSQEQLWVGMFIGQADHPLPLQGKVFPKLRKRSSIRSVDVEELGVGRATDYVFRIIYPGHRHEHSECPYVPCGECPGCVGALCHLGQVKTRGSSLTVSSLNLSLTDHPCLVLSCLPPNHPEALSSVDPGITIQVS